MVAVAIIALSIAAEQMRRRAIHYRRLAERYAIIEVACRETAARLPFMTPSDFGRMCGTMANGVRKSPRRAAYYADLRRKYEFAALHPWLPVEPDPPEP
jgi:hypothetical protein